MYLSTMLLSIIINVRQVLTLSLITIIVASCTMCIAGSYMVSDINQPLIFDDAELGNVSGFELACTSTTSYRDGKGCQEWSNQDR